jgi:hypothetical protein
MAWISGWRAAGHLPGAMVMCDSPYNRFPLAELVHALMQNQQPPTTLQDWLAGPDLDDLVSILKRLLSLSDSNRLRQPSVVFARNLTRIVCRAVHDPLSLDKVDELPLTAGTERDTKVLIEAASLIVAAVRWPRPRVMT